MTDTDTALKVTIYLHEKYTLKILDFLFFRKVTGATAFRGIAGFGKHHEMHTDHVVALSVDLPTTIEFIEERVKAEALLPKLQELSHGGLITMQEIQILSQQKSSDIAPLRRTLLGHAKLMRIYIREADEWHGQPLHRAIIEALLANEIAGVTVYRGILGYGIHHELHKQSLNPFANSDSIMLSIVEQEDRLKDFMPILDQMIVEGLVVLSDVDVIHYTSGGDQ